MVRKLVRSKKYQQDKKKVAVLICAYNEEKHIRKVVESAKKQIKDVIVVNDGSKDGTLKQLKKTKADIVSYSKNKGKGHALITGFKHARKKGYDYLILMDADGQHDPAELGKFIKAIDKGYDLVIGRRKKRHSGMPYLRRFVNFFTSLLISIRGGVRVKDTQSGYRAINLKFVEGMKFETHSYDLESEILLKMMKKKAKIGEVFIKTIYGDEVSTIHPIKESYRFFRLMFKRRKV